jgi:hypothetical protein
MEKKVQDILDKITIGICLLAIVGITLFSFHGYKETKKVKEDRIIQLNKAYEKRGLYGKERVREHKGVANRRTK